MVRLAANPEKIIQRTLPEVSSWQVSGKPFNPMRCLGVYGIPDRPGLDLAMTLIAQTAIAPLGVTATIISDFPKKIPESAVIVGTADQIQKAYPQYTSDKYLPQDGYRMHIDSSIVLIGNGSAGCIAGAHTLVQMLSGLAGEALPGMELTDFPRSVRRSVLADCTRVSPEIGTLVRLAGFVSAFKGNTIHVVLSPNRPVSHRTEPGCISVNDALEAAEACREYGITLIPSADFAGEIVHKNKSVNDMTSQAIQLAEAFKSNVLNIGKCTAASCPSNVYQFIDNVRKNIPDVKLYGNIPDAEGIILCACTPDEACYAQSLGREYAFFIDYSETGYVPTLPNDAFAAMDQASAFLNDPLCVEICYTPSILSSNILGGHDLMYWTSAVTIGWNDLLSARSAADRFASLAYGERGSAAVMRLLVELAGMFPDVLRGHEAERLHKLAFGYSGTKDDWKAFCSIDWDELTPRLCHIEDEMTAVRKVVTSNRDTLVGVSVSLHILKFCAILAQHYVGASRAYREEEFDMSRVCLGQVKDGITNLCKALIDSPSGAQRYAPELAQLKSLEEKLTSIQTLLKTNDFSLIEHTDVESILPPLWDD